MKTRSYDDPCGIARALDRVGERWALLVVRELVLGPKRFTDLKEGLPDASPNVLSARLRELEDNGVVARRQLPPPGASTVYALTPWGQDLEPVLLALGRFGSQAPLVAKKKLSVDALMLALKTTFTPSTLRARIGLCLGADRFHAHVAGRTLNLVRGERAGEDATLTLDAATLRQLTFGGKSLAAALRAGDVHLAGSQVQAARFLELFSRPPQRA